MNIPFVLGSQTKALSSACVGAPNGFRDQQALLRQPVEGVLALNGDPQCCEAMSEGGSIHEGIQDSCHQVQGREAAAASLKGSRCRSSRSCRSALLQVITPASCCMNVGLPGKLPLRREQQVIKAEQQGAAIRQLWRLFSRTAALLAVKEACQGRSHKASVMRRLYRALLYARADSAERTGSAANSVAGWNDRCTTAPRARM